MPLSSAVCRISSLSWRPSTLAWAAPAKGVNATTVVRNAGLQDAWFAGGSAARLFAKLASTPHGVLLSEEVVHDYQLRPGDQIKMRLLDQRTRAPITKSSGSRYVATAIRLWG